jgi:hypothetical protein
MHAFYKDAVNASFLNIPIIKLLLKKNEHSFLIISLHSNLNNHGETSKKY